MLEETELQERLDEEEHLAIGATLAEKVLVVGLPFLTGCFRVGFNTTQLVAREYIQDAGDVVQSYLAPDANVQAGCCIYGCP